MDLFTCPQVLKGMQKSLSMEPIPVDQSEIDALWDIAQQDLDPATEALEIGELNRSVKQLLHT
jgi:hypothetical protein